MATCFHLWSQLPVKSSIWTRTCHWIGANLHASRVFSPLRQHSHQWWLDKLLEQIMLLCCVVLGMRAPSYDNCFQLLRMRQPRCDKTRSHRGFPILLSDCRSLLSLVFLKSKVLSFFNLLYIIMATIAALKFTLCRCNSLAVNILTRTGLILNSTRFLLIASDFYSSVIDHRRTPKNLRIVHRDQLTLDGESANCSRSFAEKYRR